MEETEACNSELDDDADDDDDDDDADVFGCSF
jgi:hypothetical protein